MARGRGLEEMVEREDEGRQQRRRWRERGSTGRILRTRRRTSMDTGR